jgi:hypothetical protein
MAHHGVVVPRSVMAQRTTETVMIAGTISGLGPTLS